jgi:hypothetical protein
MIFIDACFGFSERTLFAPPHKIALLPKKTRSSGRNTMSTVNLLTKLSMATAGATVRALSVAVNAQAATTTLLEENFNTENNGSGVLNYGSFTKFDVIDRWDSGYNR